MSGVFFETHCTLTWRPLWFRNFKWTFLVPTKTTNKFAIHFLSQTNLHNKMFLSPGLQPGPSEETHSAAPDHAWTWPPLLDAEGKDNIRLGVGGKEKEATEGERMEIGPCRIGGVGMRRKMQLPEASWAG